MTVENETVLNTKPGSRIAEGYTQPLQRLEASGLRKRFKGREVVKGVTLQVTGGEVVGLLGPNGAGKTTVFDMIVGLCTPDHGDIRLNRRPITLLPMYQRARLGVGYLPQESSVFRRLTVEENVLAILELCDLTADDRALRLEHLLQELDLTHLRKSRAYTLSGGERRRLELTRALVTNPQFLLLDEPFAGIDPIAVSDVQHIITRLKEKGIGVLITDHNVQETLSITDRAYIINEGSILEAGPPEAIVQSSAARAVYLGDRFRLW